MYEKLNEIKNTENQLRLIQKDTIKEEKIKSIKNIIDKSINNMIEEITIDIINTKSNVFESKNVKEIADQIENILKESDFGTFEYIQKTGKNFFRVKHKVGINGTRFLKTFFENIFTNYLNNYSMKIISNENYVCVIFR